MKKLLATILFFLFPLMTFAAVTHVQTPLNTADCGSVTSCPLALASNSAAGNAILVCLALGAIGKTPAITDTQLNTYKLAGIATNATDGSTAFVYYTTTQTSAAADTVTATITGATVMRMSITEITGMFAGDFLDQVASSSGNGTAIATGAVTPTQNGELLYVCGRNASGTTFTAGTDFTQRSAIPAAANTRASAETYEQPTIASHDGTMTMGGSQQWAAFMMTVKPPSGVVSTPAPRGHFIFKGAKFRLNGNLFKLK